VPSLSMTGPDRGCCKGAPEPGALFSSQEEVCTLLEVSVHECSWGGVVCWQNWSEAGHVLAELSDMCWIHWVGCRSQ
jgi:hypothetical protein